MRTLYTVQVPQAIARVLELVLKEVTAQSPEYVIIYYGDRLVCVDLPLPALLPGKCLCYRSIMRTIRRRRSRQNGHDNECNDGGKSNVDARGI